MLWVLLEAMLPDKGEAESQALSPKFKDHSVVAFPWLVMITESSVCEVPKLRVEGSISISASFFPVQVARHI